MFAGVRQVFRNLRNPGIDGQAHIEGVGGEADPLHGGAVGVHTGPQLVDGQQVRPVDADGAVGAPHFAVAVGGVGIIGGALVVGGQQIFHILNGDLPLGPDAPGQIVIGGAVVRLRSVPDKGVGKQIAQHEPGPGSIVGMVRIRMGAKGGPGVEGPLHGQIQVVLLDEFRQILGKQVLFSFGVLQIQPVNAQLIGHHHHTVVRHPPGHPVVAADGFQEPDLLFVLKGNAVHFVGAVGFQQGAQEGDAFPGRPGIGQHQQDNVLFPDSALNQGIRTQHPGVGGDGFGGGHGNVPLIHTGGGPDAFPFQGVGGRGVGHGIAGQRNLHLGQDTFVYGGFLPGGNALDLFRCVVERARVIVPGDDGGAVVAGGLAHQNGCTGHIKISFVSLFYTPPGRPRAAVVRMPRQAL